jgi:hypothetical protein
VSMATPNTAQHSLLAGNTHRDIATVHRRERES